MWPISCRLVPHSVSQHIQQLYTGYRMLQQRGLINLSQEVQKVQVHDGTRPRHLQNARYAHLRVVLDGRVKVHYDAHDSWEIDEDFLAEADLYFKRSYSPERLMDLTTGRARIRPLGLNYLVYPDQPDVWALRRHIALGTSKERLLASARSLGFMDGIRFVPRVRHMEALPDYDAHPKILFMARAWEPAEGPDEVCAKEEDRRHLNEMRAECVRQLRSAFGRDFYGGLMHTGYAKAHFSDVLLPDEGDASKRAYIHRLARHSICVATTGLHGSTGWKLAEYVAFSKAIVSERLRYAVPGALAEGTHYLTFETPEECVEQVGRLQADATLRRSLMTNNARYYHSHVRPDALVLNTILEALSEGDLP
jgi:hypothetical protein